MSTEFEKNFYYFRAGEDKLLGRNAEEQVKEISNFIKHQCMSENLNFLIGSGASLPAVPLMSQTFEGIKQKEEVKDYLGSFSDSKDIENYLNWLQNAITFLGEDSSEASPYIKAFDMTKESLLQTMPNSYFDLDTNKRTTLKNYENFYRNIFNQREFKNHAPVNVFTTNYDLFNEVAMENLGINYTNGFRGSVRRIFDPYEYRLRIVDDENKYKDKWSVIRKYIKLHKLHGSADWKFNEDINSIVQHQVDHEAKTENVMIYPTVHKHLESQQSPYSELMREFTTNLQKKDSTLIVIGYGFPDDHINQLISQALNNEDFSLVVFGNHEEEKAKEFLEMNGHRENFHFIGGNFAQKNDGHHFANTIEYLGGDEKDGESE